MREDARRRFTFGITIEDTQTRFWFASQSIVLVTKPFDFMTEPKPLIQMVNFLTYATEEQLGYDTTMRRIPDSAGKLSIKIDNRTFQTEKLLADFSADSLLGRGTHVWSGFFEDTPRVSAVLKDCWAEHRELEGKVLKTLREEYAKLKSEKRNFDDYFLTMIVDSTPPLSTRAKDDTQAMMNNQVPPPNNKPLILTNRISGSDRQQQSRLPSRSIKWRYHYRISFNEVATPLYDVVKLGDHLKALMDAMIGIGILHKLGYVHRDISSGNVFFYEGRGKLSDLEYCKPSKEISNHDIRTGTRYFMSVEVASGRRLFAPRPLNTRNRGYGDMNDDDDFTNVMNDINKNYTGDNNVGPPFRFFILHDVESVWWLLTFALFANRVQGEDPNTDREDRQVENAHNLFPTGLTSTAREHAFALPLEFLGMENSLPSALHPLFRVAEALRDELTQEYARVELTDNPDQSVDPEILLYFQKALGGAIALAKNITLVPGLKFDNKRPAEEAGEDGGEGDARKMPKNV